MSTFNNQCTTGRTESAVALAGSDSLGWSYGASGDATELINEDTLARDQIAQRNTESSQQLLGSADTATEDNNFVSISNIRNKIKTKHNFQLHGVTIDLLSAFCLLTPPNISDDVIAILYNGLQHTAITRTSSPLTNIHIEMRYNSKTKRYFDKHPNITQPILLNVTTAQGEIFECKIFKGGLLQLTLHVDQDVLLCIHIIDYIIQAIKPFLKKKPEIAENTNPDLIKAGNYVEVHYKFLHISLRASIGVKLNIYVFMNILKKTVKNVTAPSPACIIINHAQEGKCLIEASGIIDMSRRITNNIYYSKTHIDRFYKDLQALYSTIQENLPAIQLIEKEFMKA